MKKLLLGLVMLALMAIPAYAFQFDKSNLEFGGEYGYSHQDIENIDVIGVNVGSFLSANLVEETTNVKTWNFLVTAGYKLSDQVTPYFIIGDSYLNLDQELRGELTLGSFSGALPILTTELRGAHGILVGAGAKGDLMKFENGLIVGYDTRWTTFNCSTTQNQATLLPSIIDYGINDKMKASLGVFTFDMALSKYFDLTKTNEDGTVTKKFIVEGVTPFLGGRWTHSDLNVKNSLTVGGVGVSLESETQGNMLSGIGGLTVKMNKNWDASIGGVVGQENGVQVKVGFHF